MNKSIHDVGSDVLGLFEARVASGPGVVAVECGGERWTYGELDGWANGLAHRLRSVGVGPEVVVGVCLGRGVGAVAGLLAVAKAGGVYLPLDSALPVERLAYMLDVAGAGVVLTTGDLLSELPVSGVRTVLVVEEAEGAQGVGGLAGFPDTPPVGPRRQDTLMYVVFTSGSTGTPKGIGVTWRTIRNVVHFDLHRDRYLGEASVVCLQLASVGFDVSFLEIFATLVRGGRLVLVGEAAQRDTEQLLELLARERVERVYLSPAHLAQLAVSWTENPRDLALGHIFVSGEALVLTSRIRAMLAGLDGVVLENQYGPSETHHATSLFLTGDPRDWPAAPGIGRPVPGTSLYLLDRHLGLTPPGVPGEIYLTGEGLAR
ncbi:AMP-binding protein, partial [Streptomyces sp. NPDC059816]|uniref:AMP-binding protein n=1 Tax=Streptomyces sp. NPDC059816 TaxID=3346960 RepID=UPI00364A74E6